MAWVEKDCNDHVVSTPCCMQGCQPPDQAAQSHIQPGLECLQGWGIHNLLGQPAPVCHHPLCEKLPPNIQPKPLPSQLKTVPPCPITIHPCKQLFPLLFICSFQVLEGRNEVSLEPSLLQARQAQFPQPFLIGEVLQPSVHLSGPPLDSLFHVPRSFFTGFPRPGHNIPDGASQNPSRGGQSILGTILLSAFISVLEGSV